MNEAPKVYRAYVNFDHRGANVWCHCGWLSACGEWVEAGDTRYRRTSEWFDTEAAAKAGKAGEVAAMGATLLKQASALTALEKVRA